MSGLPLELRQLAPSRRPCQADPDRLAEPPPLPPPTLPDTIFGALDRERGRQRYRRIGLVAAAAVIAVGLVTAGFLLRGATAGGPPGQAVAFTALSPGVEASARVENRAWGTGISLDVTGLPQGHLQRLAAAPGRKSHECRQFHRGRRSDDVDATGGGTTDVGRDDARNQRPRQRPRAPPGATAPLRPTCGREVGWGRSRFRYRP